MALRDELPCAVPKPSRSITRHFAVRRNLPCSSRRFRDSARSKLRGRYFDAKTPRSPARPSCESAPRFALLEFPAAASGQAALPSSTQPEQSRGFAFVASARAWASQSREGRSHSAPFRQGRISWSYSLLYSIGEPGIRPVLADLQFARGRKHAHSRARRYLPLLFLLLACLVPGLAPVNAQQSQPPPGTIGRVEGNDVSIEGGSAAANGTSTTAPSMFVANGSVITVHSGQARMTLVGGGQIDVCGPAKFTLLQSGPAITLALNFGRMRVQLPAAVQLRIFTPTIVATPIDIGGAPRDFTVGLDLNDSLCVVATSGALRLEHQFTGEGLIVPQSGEFFLAAGKLMPVAGVAGTCQCASLQARNSGPLPASPEMGLTAKPQPDPAPVPEVASKPPAHLDLPPPAVPSAGPAVTSVSSRPRTRFIPTRNRSLTKFQTPQLSPSRSTKS